MAINKTKRKRRSDQQLKQVLTNLNRRIGKIKGATSEGLLDSAIDIYRRSQSYCPVRISNLKASGHVMTLQGPARQDGNFKGKNASEMESNHNAEMGSALNTIQNVSMKAGGGPVVGIGYTALYALYVHETPTAGEVGYDPARDAGKPAYKSHSEVGQWKFLQTAVEELRDDVIKNIKRRAKF